MELSKVQEQLQKEFSGRDRTIIFWYDESGEFAEDVNQLGINAEVFALNGRNYFEAKYKIEYDDPTTNYLVYAPFKKPDDEKNPLLDLLLYSKQFYADHYSLLAEEIGVPSEFKDQLEPVNTFFASKARRNDFIALNGEFKSELDIDLAILAVLSRTKVMDYPEVFRSVVNQGIQNNKYLIEFEKYNVIDSFWDLTGKYFGYYDENPTLEKLLISIFLTNIYNVSEVDFSKDKDRMVLKKKQSESTVFLNNYKNNIQYGELFDSLSSYIGAAIDARNLAKEIGFGDIKSNDVFKEFDEVYIEQLLEYGEQQVNLDSIEQYLDYRENTHYYDIYQYEYETLRNAFHLLDLINKFTRNFSTITPQQYTNEYAVIDKYYDLYVYNYKKVNNQGFSKLNDLVENKYNNAYFNKLNMAWDSKLLEYGSYDAIPGTKQRDFYSRVVYPNLSKNKVCVIISDAMRFECGIQMHDYLDSLPKYDVLPMRYMVSTIPSYTELGMAALLPNDKLTFTDEYKVLLNEKNTDGIDNRNKILQSRNKAALAVKFDDIKGLGKQELRDKILGAELLYVYHNQIDAKGDHYSTEDEVFDAVQEGIDEIELLMRKLRDNANFTQFFITSDHGFIYRRKKLEESDKISLLLKDSLQINKRYVYSKSRVLQDGTIEYKMEYLDKSNSIYTYVPKGGNLFKVQGPGQNYVHGGASLQEIIIPLIEVKTTMRKVETTKVNVDLLAANYKVTSISTQLKFVQVEAVTDKKIAQTYKAVFVDENNNPISNECMIYANSESEDVSERMTISKFSFISKKYDSTKNYYLVLFDENGIEYKRFNFILDIVK